MAWTDLIRIASDEYKAFIGAKDRRSHAQGRVGLLYDTYIEPLDAPGPDSLIDPAARAILVFLTGLLYDAIVKRLEDDTPHPPWPALPDASEPTAA